MKTIGFRARCPRCETERDLVGPLPAATPAELDLAEMAIDRDGPRVAKCPTCGAVEYVAMHVNGKPVEPWQHADEMERQHGPSAGPLPRKPWPDTN